MTQFALTIWAYRETGSATALGIVNTTFIVPFLLLAPIAGVMVDRYNRKLMMMVSDLAAVTATVGLADHPCNRAAANVAPVCGLGHQWVGKYIPMAGLLCSHQHHGTQGTLQPRQWDDVIGRIRARSACPHAGWHSAPDHPIDRHPDPGCDNLLPGNISLAVGPRTAARQDRRRASRTGNIWQEAVYGFKYIFARRGLLGLLIFFICLNFTIGLSISLFSPFILSRTENSSAILGVAQSTAAIGAVIGGLLISLWGGFKRRMTSIFIGEALTGLFCLVVFGLGRSLPVWIIATVAGGIFPVFTNGASQAIWQAKVAPDVQGRVFSARRMIAWAVNPITPILAGVLADYVTEPAMQSNTWLANTFSWLVGTSPGSGMALQFVYHRNCLYADCINHLPVRSGSSEFRRSTARSRPDERK